MADYVDVPRLIASGVHPTQARVFAAPLSRACEQFEIITRERIAAFIAQLMHESQAFSRLEESLWYTTPERIRQVFSVTVPSIEVARTLTRKPQMLANRVYANKNGNGPESSGDGWKYRGRGLIMTTGRANYANAQRLTGQPLVDRPDLLLAPNNAAMAAAGYWGAANCNRLADAYEIDRITRAINGAGMEGAARRRDLFEETMEAFA